MASFAQRVVKGRSKKAQNIPFLAKLGKYVMNPDKLVDIIEDLLFNSDKSFLVMCILLPLELFLNLLIVFNIKYTEIDWVAYMQEVEGFLNGTFNYYELKGDTGPLVYPAGFVYIYSLFYAVTSKGVNIPLGQFIFVAIYLLFISTVFFIYKKTKRVPPVALVIMCLTSHRIHSIFVLRLFNDPIGMCLLYLAIACFLMKFWRMGCIFYSLAVSVKMNVILFAPGLFVILCLAHGFFNTLKYISLCAVVQLILGIPFLFTYPVEYIHRSFDLGRKFFFIWTVNWKFLPEDVFQSRVFHSCLLALHVTILLGFLNKSLRNIGGLRTIFNIKRTVKLNADFIIFTMFTTNFIGICFSRSLHYQFYVWYYHTIAYMLWSTSFPNSFKFLLYGIIEFCWNVYPSTYFSSLLLNLCHFVLLGGLWRALDSDNTVRLTMD